MTNGGRNINGHTAVQLLNQAQGEKMKVNRVPQCWSLDTEGFVSRDRDNKMRMDRKFKKPGAEP